MIIWTVEETDLISCYWREGSTITELRSELYRAFPYMEPEMQLLTEKVLKRLDKLSEKEYRQMKFIHSGSVEA